MSAARTGSVTAVPGGGLLLGLVVALGTAAYAQQEARLRLPLIPEDLSADDLYDRHEAWRETPAARYGWRGQPAPEPEARITLGYDSVWEKERLEREERVGRPGLDLQDPGTSTLFRLRF